MSAAWLVMPFAAVFVLVANILVILGMPLMRVMHNRWATQHSMQQALFVFAPWLLAILVVLALATPNPFAPCHCIAHGLHHPHLCWTHPGHASSLIVPALVVLGVWLLLAAPRLVRIFQHLFATIVWARTIRRLPEQNEDGIAFRQINCETPGVFTVGVWSPVIVVDQRLWATLSAEERRAVLYHEQGHIERRDGLTLFALRFCMTLAPTPWRESFLSAWKNTAEKACDAHAALKLGDATTVASALVSVETTLQKLSTKKANDLHFAFGVVAGAQLEERVIALLNMPPQIGESRLGNDVLAAALITLGAAAVTLVWPGDNIHHATETLIGLLVH